MFKQVLILITLLTYNYVKADTLPTQSSIVYNSVTSWTTSGLDNTEVAAIDEASQAELSEISDCMNDYSTNEIADTSCVSDVLGDVHN